MSQWLDPELGDSLDEELKAKVLNFLRDYDMEDDRDPFYVSEVIFNVPEENIREWVETDLREKTSVVENQRLGDNFRLILHSLDSLKKSILQVSEYNRQLLEEYKRRTSG